MPVHSYNSVIYASIGANDYLIFAVNPTFVERYENVSSFTTSLSYDEFVNLTTVHKPSVNQVLRQLQKSALAGELDRLNNEDCIQSYGKMYLSNRRNLLLVKSEVAFLNGWSIPSNTSIPSDTSIPSIPSIFIPNEVIDKPQPPLNCAVDPVPWICPNYDCEVACVNRLYEVEPRNWKPQDWKGYIVGPVDYCLSQPTEESCKMQFSLPIAIVIIFFNFFKAVIMLILAFGLREARVQTIGDAIASFLIQPDDIVNGRCLYSVSDFKHAGLSGNPRDLIFTNKSMRFTETGEKRIWLLTYIL